MRAVCGLSLGDATQMRPAAMVNLLGDLWINGEPDWAAAMAIPDVKLHLYGKADAARRAARWATSPRSAKRRMTPPRKP